MESKNGSVIVLLIVLVLLNGYQTFLAFNSKEAKQTAKQPESSTQVLPMNKTARINIRIDEIKELHKKGMGAKTYREGSKLVGKAKRLLGTLPVPGNGSVNEEIDNLTVKQLEIEEQLALIRLRRYNQWALQQIKEASKVLKQYKNGPMAGKIICRVEPSYLEPLTTELYTEIIKKILEVSDEKSKVEIVKKITDPENNRKSLIDF